MANESNIQNAPRPNVNEVLGARFEDRAELHRKSARRDMLAILAIIAACVIIFVGAESFTSALDWAFMSSGQRQADLALREAEVKLKLAEAKSYEAEAKLQEAIADLAEPTAEAIRAIPAVLRPIIRDLLNLPGESPTPNTEPAPTNGSSSINYQELSANRPAPYCEHDAAERNEAATGSMGARDASTAKDAMANDAADAHGAPDKDHPTTAEDPLDSILESMRLRRVPENTIDWVQIEDTRAYYEAEGRRVVALVTANAEARAAAIDADARIEIAEIEADAMVDAAEEEAEALVEVAEEEASSREEVAQSQADALENVASEEAEARIAVADLETKVALDINSRIAGAITRISCVVLIIWLVRIFLRKREHSIMLSSHYSALGDALAVCNFDDPDRLERMVLLLGPPRTTGDPTTSDPVDDLYRLLKAARGNK